MKKVNPLKIPSVCGVYAFSNKKGEYLYIGKAKNIKKRIKSHQTRKNLFVTDNIKIEEKDSEFEALILESQLIKKYRPKHNVLWKDDKEYFYLNKTKNKYPRLLINHDKKGLGPFVKGKELKKALEALRYVFPFYQYKKHPQKKCSFCYLNLCPGPDISLKEYQKNINSIFAIFSGKKKSVLNSFRKEMQRYSLNKEYEKAALVRDKILAIEKIIFEAKIMQKSSLEKFFRIKEKRIEAYDVSNLQGEKATGAMVVFLGRKSAKHLYRKFKISSNKPNDTAMLKEVLLRRLQHKEWPLPELILIDGGKAQLNIALKLTKDIKVAALAKKKNELFFNGQKVFLKDLPDDFAHLILNIRDEAHRFAISYHKKLRNKID